MFTCCCEQHNSHPRDIGVKVSLGMKQLHLQATLTSLLILAALLWFYAWTKSTTTVEWWRPEIAWSMTLEDINETKSLLTYGSNNKPTEGARVLLLAYGRQVWL